MVLSLDEFLSSSELPESQEAFAKSLILKLGYQNPVLKSMAPGAFLFKVGFHHILVLEPETKYSLISSLKEEYPKHELGGYVFFYITGQEMTSDFLYDGKYLVSTFKFSKFVQVKKFIEDVLELSYRKDHTPQIEFDGNNKVTIRLYTTLEDKVTEMDIAMGEDIARIKNRIQDTFI